MGKYVTSVGSSTVVLIEDTPDIVQQSVLNSIQKNRNIATDLIDTVSNSYGLKVRQAYNYARDHYVYGLPEGTIGHLQIDEVKLREVMDTFVTIPANGSYTILSAQISPLLLNLFGNEAFSFDVDNPYDFATDKVQNVTVVNGNDFDDSITGSFPINSTEILFSGRLRCSFVHFVTTPSGDADTVVKYQTFIDIPQRNASYNQLLDKPNEFYYYVAYQILDAGGVPQGLPKLWNYWENSTKYPSLALSDKAIQTNQYMPVIPIRVSNNTLYDKDKEKESDAYKTSKRLLKILDLDIDELTDGVNENPDIDKVDHAYITLGVNVFTDKSEAIIYLFEYMKYMHTVGRGIRNQITISDETYHTILQWESSSFRQYTGSIGRVRTTEKEIVLGDIDKLIVRKQISETQIQEYTVNDLVFHNRIYTTGMEVTTALDGSKESQEALCIPINISIIENILSPLEANKVYYDSLRIVFNSLERTKLKWYQTGLFQIVTIVIAVAITYFSGGTLTQFAFALVSGVLINIGLQLLVKISTGLFGEDVGRIVAVVAVIVAIAYGFISGKIPDVTALLQVGISVGSTLVNQFVATELGQVQAEVSTFLEQVEEKQDILEQLQSQLNNNVQVDPLGIYSSVGMIPQQSIGDYFYTKLELPITAGAVSIDVLHNWVDTQLTLPSI